MNALDKMQLVFVSLLQSIIVTLNFEFYNLVITHSINYQIRNMDILKLYW
jgi:hypothetical protein